MNVCVCVRVCVRGIGGEKMVISRKLPREKERQGDSTKRNREREG